MHKNTITFLLSEFIINAKIDIEIQVDKPLSLNSNVILFNHTANEDAMKAHFIGLQRFTEAFADSNETWKSSKNPIFQLNLSDKDILNSKSDWLNGNCVSWALYMINLNFTKVFSPCSRERLK